MRLIACMTTPLGDLDALGVMLLAVILLHLIVFEASFARQEEAVTPVRAFFDFTPPGHALCLLAGLAMLWVVGGADGHGLQAIMTNVVILAFPAANAPAPRSTMSPGGERRRPAWSSRRRTSQSRPCTCWAGRSPDAKSAAARQLPAAILVNPSRRTDMNQRSAWPHPEWRPCRD